ncbi:MAG TPA: prepilin peptidase [Bryobacteraceae bacterium]|nr:prepilin peptidase [Bryobacteraceae bacterium]
MPAEYNALFVAFAAVLGLLIGSFLNVCIYRLPRDISVVAPRSFCPECGKQIAWYDNIPFASYVLLRGKCRYCVQKIGLRYPAVELSTAVLFAGVAYRYGVSSFAWKWLLWEAILVVLFWTDVEERILPDELTIGGSVVGLILAFFIPVPAPFAQTLFPGWSPIARSFASVGMGLALLAVPMWALGFFYEKVRGREGLGFGDVKLLVLMSVFLGFEKALLATMMGAIGGSILGIVFCLATRRKISETHLPFGSFLCAGASVTPLLERLI